MESVLLNDTDGLRTYAVILETGDEAMSCLKSFAMAERLGAAQLVAIGAFSRVVLAYFDWETKKYLHLPFEEQMEVASFTGDIALSPKGAPALHAHLVLGRRDGTALAGHLIEGWVRPTLEVIVTEPPIHLQKQIDPETGLSFIRPRQSRGEASRHAHHAAE